MSEIKLLKHIEKYYEDILELQYESFTMNLSNITKEIKSTSLNIEEMFNNIIKSLEESTKKIENRRKEVKEMIAIINKI